MLTVTLTSTYLSDPSLKRLKTDFSNMEKKNTRYMRLYEACDNK